LVVQSEANKYELKEQQLAASCDLCNERFEVFTAVTMKNGVFWGFSPLQVAAGVVPSSPIFVTLMKGSRFLRNVGSYKSHTA
jgi:hypothetical protein